MRAAATLTIIALLFSIPPARADFTVLRPDATAAADSAPATTTTPSEAAEPPGPGKPPGPRLVPRHLTAIVARGFGKQIPLSFAVRQIVPTPVQVRFGEGADSSALVDWQGGRRWAVVLRDAVRPLGLRVSVRAKEVIIER